MEVILETLMGAPNKDQPVKYRLSPPLRNHPKLCSEKPLALGRTFAARLRLLLLTDADLLACKSFSDLAQKISKGGSIPMFQDMTQVLIVEGYIHVVNTAATKPGGPYRAGYMLTEKGQNVRSKLKVSCLVPIMEPKPKVHIRHPPRVKSYASPSSDPAPLPPQTAIPQPSTVTSIRATLRNCVRRPPPRRQASTRVVEPPPIDEAEDDDDSADSQAECEDLPAQESNLNRFIRQQLNAIFLPYGAHDELSEQPGNEILMQLTGNVIAHGDCLLYSGPKESLSGLRRLIVTSKLDAYRFHHVHLSNSESGAECEEIARHHPVYCEFLGTTHERCIRPGHLAFGSNSQNRTESRLGGKALKAVRGLLADICAKSS